MFAAYASAFAYETPTKSAPTNPGPYVQLIASISSKFIFASFSAFLVTLEIASTWLRDAISGTTPPNFSWIGTCELIILDKTSLPFFTTDTDVSSQLDSIPNIYILHFLSFSHFLYWFL